MATMTEPLFDKDGYPSNDTLRAIENWSLEEGYAALMAFVRLAWSSYGTWEEHTEQVFGQNRASAEDHGHTIPKPNVYVLGCALCQKEWETKIFYRRYVLVTGGWSGNEELVGALAANGLFQSLCAESWQRGGRYEYRVMANEP